jgi:hypothetical protein
MGSAVNSANFGLVSSMKKMVSSMTMQAAVSSVNWALKPKPSLPKKLLAASRSATGMLTKMDVDMAVAPLLKFFLNKNQAEAASQPSTAEACARQRASAELDSKIRTFRP